MTKTVLVTGASGFIGKNLCSRLEVRKDITLIRFTRDNTQEDLSKFISKADFIFHLAGVNRPKDDSEFTVVNQGLTKSITNILRSSGRKVPVLFTSSTQAESDNPYGRSKESAESLLLDWSNETKNPIYLYRLPGIFGKWCRPNYNSVVATFCHNIANNLPIQISDPQHKVTLAYIDEVVDEFTRKLDNPNSDSLKQPFYAIPRTFEISLSELKDKILSIHDIRSTLIIPSLEDNLNKYLYATYISYLPTNDFSYELVANKDERGWLAEFIKSKQFGQIFISKTKPGVSRGDHWHHTKIEKFLVVEGDASILFRNKVDSQDIIKYEVTGNTPTALDIPTGYVHSITNTGSKDLITLFWANEILDKDNPDTYYEKVTTNE